MSEKPCVKIEVPYIFVRPGGVMSLEAKVTGQPVPDVTWTYNNKEISSDVKLTTDGNKYKIFLEKPESRHSGFYKITASNIAGQDFKEIPINILGTSIKKFLRY